MREASTKILLGFLMITLIAPTVFFARPQKAEALVSLAACISAKLAALATAVGPVLGNAIASVSTSDKPAETAASIGPAGQDWVQCLMKGLAKIIAKTLLHTFTQSIVKWINTGFQGSPSFITNPEGFLNDVADQTVGRVIEDISPLLCAPFRLDIRLALGLNLSLKTEDEFHCRLSDVIDNVRGAYDGFVTGAVGSGNLSRWVHIAGTQANNPYGAYIATTNKLSVGITSATGQQIKLLDWGEGFKSWRPCVKRRPDIYAKNEIGGQLMIDGKFVKRKGSCIEEGPIQTPGSVIVAQANESLKGTLDELRLADEIDEIVGALINQLLVKALTGVGGLLGASSGSNSAGGISAVDELTTDPAAIIAGAEAKIPAGIDNCRLRYYPATKETSIGSGIYIPDEDKTTVYTDRLTAGAASEPPLIVANGASRGSDGVGASKETWTQYFARVRAGCRNQYSTLIANSETTARQSYNTALGDTGGSDTSMPPMPPTPTPPAPVNFNREISLASAALNQSFVYNNPNTGQSLGPEQALYGFSWSSTYGDPSSITWWTASLNKIEEIKMIRFRPHEDPGYYIDRVVLSTVGDDKMGIPLTREEVGAGSNKVSVYTRGTVVNGVELTENNPSSPGKDVTLTFTTPIKANAIAIYTFKPGYLTLRSVKLYRPYEAPLTAVTPPTPPFSFTVNPSQFSLLSPERGRIFPGSQSFISTFTANQPKSGISFRAKLYDCTTISPVPVSCPNYTLADFLTNFNSLNFEYTAGGSLPTVKNAINLPSAGVGRTYNASTDLAGTTVEADRLKPNLGVTFLKNLSVGSESKVRISVTGSLAGEKIPFRIVIEAVENAGQTNEVILESVEADFATQ